MASALTGCHHWVILSHLPAIDARWGEAQQAKANTQYNAVHLSHGDKLRVQPNEQTNPSQALCGGTSGLGGLLQGRSVSSSAFLLLLTLFDHQDLCNTVFEIHAYSTSYTSQPPCPSSHNSQPGRARHTKQGVALYMINIWVIKQHVTRQTTSLCCDGAR